MNTKEMKKLLEAQKLQTYFLLNKNPNLDEVNYETAKQLTELNKKN